MDMMEKLVADVLASGSKSFRKMQLNGAKLRALDLKGYDFRGASVINCDFTDSDLTYVNGEGGNWYGSNFTNAKLYRTNFKDAQLAYSTMYPRDLYGTTITLECNSFKGMKVAPGWWYGWLFYMLLAEPPSKDAEEKLIQCLGPERYSVLRTQYMRREM